jgi:uncharacterized protein with HEPN domain
MSRDIAYVLDIYQSAQMIRDYVANLSKEAFEDDYRTQDAVIRRLEIIGEATKRLSDEFRTDHPEIAWKSMSGMRDILIHDYDDVELDIVWEVATQRIPPLIEQIEPLIPNENSL